MTVGDGKSQCRKMTLCCASRSGAVLASCLSALLLLPGLTAAAPGSAAGGPGNGPAAGQASSARQEACVQAAQEMEDESHPETLPEKPTPPSKAGTLELHGTFRYLYGQGRFDGRALSPPHRPPGSLPGKRDPADVPHTALPGLPSRRPLGRPYGGRGQPRPE